MSFRIYQSFENSTPFLRGYKEMKIPVLYKDGRPVWPQLFPLERIDQMREIVGHRHFSSQMMLEYISEEKICLDPGAVIFYADEFDARTATLGNNRITGRSVYWDPSSGRAKADGSVCVLLYRDDKNRRAFVHDIRYLTVADQELYPLAAQCDAVLDFMRKNEAGRIAIEVNGIGNALPEIMAQESQKRGQPVTVQKVTNHQSKKDRILNSIEPLLSTGRLLMHDRIRRSRLPVEMLGWSPAGAAPGDDGLDAVAGALRVQPTPVRSNASQCSQMRAMTDFQI
jgi:hypothetical protein